ncbi:MAG: universal stress protein [Terracidiphilus sp.]|jgi:nucleotide-binding universal stress UspA family protein
MAAALRPGWVKPATILFACEFPVNEKAFGVALAEAIEFDAGLIVFHAYDSAPVAGAQSAGLQRRAYGDCRAQRERFEPLAQRAENLGVRCSVVVRPGRAADEILKLLRELRVDRVVMGAHTPGPIGKLLVGSVAEAVLRGANVPVNIVGPFVADDAYRRVAGRTILCSTCAQSSSCIVARFVAELAAKHKATLILQHVIPPQESAEILAGRNLGQMATELYSFIPAELQGTIDVRTRAFVGDPTEDLLYQSRSQRANLIVMGAQGASPFAAATRSGIVYKVLAYAHCPVITLSPIVLAECGATEQPIARVSESSMAGVF